MKSPCKECKFAQYEGKTQTDCSLGLIDKYRQKGVLEECYDEEKEFFVVGQLCMYSRGPEWDGGEKEVREEVKFKADLVIISKNLEELRTTLENAAQFESIIVVNSGAPVNEVVPLLKGKFKKWYIDSTFVETPGREIDVATKKAKAPYYVVVQAGTEIPEDYCERVNAAVENGLLAFIAMKTVWPYGSASVYNRPIHKLLSGHEDTSIEEKVKEICKISEQPIEKYLLEVEV